MLCWGTWVLGPAIVWGWRQITAMWESEKNLFSLHFPRWNSVSPLGQNQVWAIGFRWAPMTMSMRGVFSSITCQAATSTTALPRCWNSWSGSLETTSVGRMVCNSFLDVRKVCVPECFRVAKCYSSLGGWGRSCVQLSPTIMLLIFRLSPFGQAAPLSASQGDESSGSWSQVCIQVVSLWSWWPTGFGWKMRAMFT